MQHFTNGRPCDCKVKFSDSPSNYVRLHPNKREPEGGTFNDTVANSIAKRL